MNRLGILAILLVPALIAAVGVSLALADDLPFSVLNNSNSDPSRSAERLPNFGVTPATHFQESASADGHVSDEEMAAAVEATAACIREKGFEVSVVAADPRDRIARSFVVVMRSEESPSAVVFACKDEFMSDLDLIYSSQEGAKSPITVAEGTRLFDECLTANGYPPPPGPPVNPYSAERLAPLDATVAGGQAIMRCNKVVEDAHRGGPATTP